MRVLIGILLPCFLAASCASTGALTMSPTATPSERLFAGPEVAAPLGLNDYCSRDPEDCTQAVPVAAERTQVALTHQRWRELSGVNRVVNETVASAEDIDIYGVEEYWTRPADVAARGDCEDYALEKRAQLIALGWPSESLAIAVAVAPRRGAHAALIAQTDEGDYVLDNLLESPTRLDSLNYVWVSRQVGPNLARWALASATSGPGAAAPVLRTAEDIFQYRLAQAIAEAQVARVAAVR